MGSKKELTPLMKQYWSVKSVHPDKIVLFRMGDFFEMFHDDAVEAAPVLGIALTMRNKKSGDQTPMCGVPHHSIGGQINKLLASGRKVAICDQVEDPKLAKGLVKREVTRVLTPGMVYDPETLEAQKPNYLSAFDTQHLSFLESTTGECFYYPVCDFAQVVELISSLRPVEIVCANSEQQELFKNVKHESWAGTLSLCEGDKLGKDKPSQSLPKSAQLLLAYVNATQGSEALGFYQDFEVRQHQISLKVSSKVLSHLEVFETYKGDKKGSLFHAIDRTRTAGGARLLRQWLTFPLADKKSISQRHDQVERWTQDLAALKLLRQKLSLVGDLERRLGKISQPQAHPRDLQSLGDSTSVALELLPLMSEFGVSSETTLGVGTWVEKVQRALVDEIPNAFREGGFIQRGFHTTLDELIELSENSQKTIRNLEAQERELTGISSLKIRYNNVFGFYIEVTNTHKDKVPKERYQRKQTLTNAERYVSEELSEIEKKVITAKTKRSDLELEILKDLRDQVFRHMSSFVRLARACNQLDGISSLAWLALEESYVRPEMSENTGFALQGCRHPVVEQLSPTSFIANDIDLKPEQCLLLTGPNMAGKSTLMRQVALASIMAQMGSFVPAGKAQLPLLDKIFTRIGASDHLSEGLSTFMVEMQETAEMLKEATPRTLVVLDEVGRGTSTYDGMSLAQAILEHFLGHLKPYTLFATHYHELTEIESRFEGRLLNKHMAIHEDKGEILFRYHLSDGPAHKSYGIQVARLAGLPKDVVNHAQKILKNLEQKQKESLSTSQLDFWQNQELKFAEEKTEAPQADRHLVKALQNLEIQKLTPLEALNQLAQWQQELS